MIIEKPSQRLGDSEIQRHLGEIRSGYVKQSVLHCPIDVGRYIPAFDQNARMYEPEFYVEINVVQSNHWNCMAALAWRTLCERHRRRPASMS